ncbi:hypothetical protein ACFLVO_03140 [Chloroflexota bacterium]
MHYENEEAKGIWRAHHVKPVGEGGGNDWQSCLVLCATSSHHYLNNGLTEL